MEEDKYYYSIAEAAKITEVKPSTIRYWEKTFKTLNPKRSKNGRRVYTKKDIEMLDSIKKLLYEENYKIKGASNVVKSKEPTNIDINRLKFLESEIKGLIKILS